MATQDTKNRRFRTVVQAFVAFLVAVPVAVAVIPIPDKYNDELALALGICAALVIVIQRVQTALEDRGTIPTLARTPDGEP